MTRKSLAGRKRKELESSEPPLLRREEVDVVTLPSIVDEAAFFDAGPGFVVFDLSRTEVLLDAAVRGLIRAARSGEMRLLLRPGMVLNRLKRLFGSALRPERGEQDVWLLEIPGSGAGREEERRAA
jgi:hypothetical protein